MAGLDVLNDVETVKKMLELGTSSAHNLHEVSNDLSTIEHCETLRPHLCSFIAILQMSMHKVFLASATPSKPTVENESAICQSRSIRKFFSRTQRHYEQLT
jgi:hypothetical protein